MADKTTTAFAYSSQDAALALGTPSSLQAVAPVKDSFDLAHDPSLKAQRDALIQSEAQRRAQGDGSTMVKLHKPFPELRPKHTLAPIRQSFNQQWLSEHRAAALKALKTQEPSNEAAFPKRAHER